MREFENFDQFTGKATTKFSNEVYLKAGDYLIITADYETTTEKVGVITGKFTQIWRKTSGYF
ncbi:unnamed protein product [Strongylus vulgaris]|uniref:Uncharacterized protein n=1 Tax=Strongylus vulgaris TaxID=40348 RepID=A0A3P7LY46_STRVU|nr:unnamed protein product [Strongylus vulgaris]